MFAKSFGNSTELYVVRPDGTGERLLTSCAASCSDLGDYAPSWSPDGKRIVYSHGRELWIVNADGSGAHALTRCVKQLCAHSQPSWSPDGTRIAFIAGSGTLWLVRPDGTTLRRLFACQGRSCLYVSQPKWSPDAKTILFAGGILGGHGGQIFALTLNESLRTLASSPPPQCCAVYQTPRTKK